MGKKGVGVKIRGGIRKEGWVAGWVAGWVGVCVLEGGNERSKGGKKDEDESEESERE